MPNPCKNCKRFVECQEKYQTIMEALFLAAKDKDVPECPFIEYDFYHGIEGVFA